MRIPIDMSEIRSVFFDEAADHIAEMERLLLAIDPGSPGAEELNSIFRAAHSIKGSSGTFGCDDMAETTHEAETLLHRVRKGELALTRGMVDALLEAGDVLRAQLARHRNGKGDPVDAARITARLNALARGEAQPTQKATMPREARAGAGNPGCGPTDAAPPTWGRRASDDPKVAVAPAGRRTNDKQVVGPDGDSNSIRIGVQKVDRLIDLVGGLASARAALAQRAAAHANLANGMADLERSVRDLQEAVSSIRMLPMAFVFNRYPRMLRDLAAKLGKHVELDIVGRETECDKSVLEKISDPVTHLVRNSVDHGIETPEARLAAGKPACGTLTLSAWRRSGSIFIEVRDDGKGLDRERIIGRARERGLEVSDAMSDEEVWQLIFVPGVSTADAITDVSGRGVGMDIVRRNIAAVGGTILLDSANGRGTRVTVRLPVTGAIMNDVPHGAADDAWRPVRSRSPAKSSRSAQAAAR